LRIARKVIWQGYSAKTGKVRILAEGSYDSLAGDDVEGPAPTLPENVRRALEIRSELCSASVKKLPKMRAR
jgi:hypothetical protein